MAVNPDVTIEREIVKPEVTVRLRSDGIVHVHFAKNTTVDVELQYKIWAVYKEITNNKKLKFLFTADEGVALSREARERAKREVNPSISAYAIVANNLAYRIIASFVLKVNRPMVPFKLFGSAEEGVKWLKSLS